MANQNNIRQDPGTSDRKKKDQSSSLPIGKANVNKLVRGRENSP